MHTLIRTEVLKLRTVRSPWLLLGAVPLLVIAGISGLVMSNPGKLADPGTQANALAHVGIAALFTLAFGILAVAGEYRHKTITDSYLTTPGRGQVVGAKLVGYAVFGALAGLVASGAGLGVAAAWWSAKGVPFAWGNSAMWTTIGGGIAANAAFAAIGVGVGALIRNLVGAIAIALAWVAVVEGIVGQLVGNLARWLPFSASQALGGGDGRDTLATHLLPRLGGGAVLAVYTALFAVAAIATSVRRDVA
ncbi:MAG TPA: ABC transporter permease subunit [Trebonia sp.]